MARWYKHNDHIADEGRVLGNISKKFWLVHKIIKLKMSPTENYSTCNATCINHVFIHFHFYFLVISSQLGAPSGPQNKCQSLCCCEGIFVSRWPPPPPHTHSASLMSIPICPHLSPKGPEAAKPWARPHSEPKRTQTSAPAASRMPLLFLNHFRIPCRWDSVEKILWEVRPDLSEVVQCNGSEWRCSRHWNSSTSSSRCEKRK